MSELIFICPTGSDEKVDAEKSDDEQGRGVELQEVSMDVAEIHPLIHGNAYCHSREEECIETWRRAQSEIIKHCLQLSSKVLKTKCKYALFEAF